MFAQDTSRNVRKRTSISVRLRIRALWSEISLDAFWIAKSAPFLYVDNENSDQTALSRLTVFVRFKSEGTSTFSQNNTKVSICPSPVTANLEGNVTF